MILMTESEKNKILLLKEAGKLVIKEDKKLLKELSKR